MDIDNRDLGSYVSEAQRLINKELSLPAGYSLKWSGQYEYLERAQERLMTVVPLTLVIILLLLYLSFRRFSDVFIIMVTLPFALIGGIWLLFSLNYNFSVAVMVGFIALLGVAVEIGILMLVYLNQAYKKQQEKAKQTNHALTHDNLKEAIIDGALMRVRPIFMTLVSIVIGLLPIMLGSGTGSEVMRRIAAPMVGGMISATILTLLVLPAAFLLWKSRSLKT